ncbi:MAG: helix-turn-helix transcriptional regulator [Oscillospiraceae bacterium]|nr:helix-turn-helix transcriptional regulator [Oscillospiraceae bacterium]
MSSMNLPFGEFVKHRRESLGKTQKGFATEVKISPAYLSDIENGNRRAPEKFLERFAKALNITSQDELNAFYDMAGISQRGQHSDINTYIDDKPSARLALRTAMDTDLTDDDWRELIEIIKKKKRK